MTLTLRLTNVDSLADGGPVTYSIPAGRFEFGRDPAMDWTLPDPQRFVSSRHGEIRFEDGVWWLHDLSTNGTFVNGATGRVKSPWQLSHGDRLQVGSYLIGVEIAAVANVPAPSIDTIGEAAPPPPPAADIWSLETSFVPPSRHFDPTPPPARNFDTPDPGPVAQPDREEPVAVAPPVPEPTPAPLPDPVADEDAGSPFDDPPPPDPTPVLASPDPDPDTAPEPAATPEADDPPPGPDPEPVHARPPQADPGPAPLPDPRRDIVEQRAAPMPAAEAVPKPAPMPGGPAPLPTAPEPPSAAPVASPAPSLSGGLSPMPGGAAPVSPTPAPFPAAPGASASAPQAPPWQRVPPVAPSPAAPGVPGAAVDDPSARAAFGSVPPQSAAPVPGAASIPGAHALPAAAAGPGPEALLRTICEGAGMNPDALSGIDPHAAGHEIGRALRIVTAELANLLRVRMNAKLSMRSGSRTELSAEANNPLKFVPTVEEAFETMFGAPRPGFMRGAEAVQASFSDVRLHQYAVYAAIQPALAELLDDLEPDEIQNKVEAGPFSSKSAKSWELFVERWDAKTEPHENGMFDVFQIYFSRAYDQAVKKGPG